MLFRKLSIFRQGIRFCEITYGKWKDDDAIINAIEEERIPLPGEIVKCVESYISSVE